MTSLVSNNRLIGDQYPKVSVILSPFFFTGLLVTFIATSSQAQSATIPTTIPKRVFIVHYWGEEIPFSYVFDQTLRSDFRARFEQDQEGFEKGGFESAVNDFRFLWRRRKSLPQTEGVNGLGNL